MPYMYILRYSDGSLQAGSTFHLRQRFHEHQIGKRTNYCGINAPFTLVFSEYYSAIREAFKRENQIQGWSKAQKEALIAGDLEPLKQIAQSKQRIKRELLYSSKQIGSTQQANRNRTKAALPVSPVNGRSMGTT